MKIYEHFEKLPQPAAPCVVAIGSFDGIHRGHQLLFEQVCSLARQRQLQAGALTFRPHPAKVLSPKYCPPLLMPPERRLRGLASLGLDFVLAQHFDVAFASLPAQQFAKQVLATRLGVRVVVVGDDFSFGRSREGLAKDLVAFGQEYGFEVLVVRRLVVEHMMVSSTRIRSFVLQGRVRGAAVLLGRSFAVGGEVVRGLGRGRQLGFPTVNLQVEGELIPAHGVYRCVFWPAGQEAGLCAVTNVGTCPTFGPGKTSVEIHVPGENLPDLTGQKVVLAFCERLRDERRFDSPEALCRQIARDREKAQVMAQADNSSLLLPALEGF